MHVRDIAVMPQNSFLDCVQLRSIACYRGGPHFKILRLVSQMGVSSRAKYNVVRRLPFAFRLQVKNEFAVNKQ